jgi:hypothetical protein
MKDPRVAIEHDLQAAVYPEFPYAPTSPHPELKPAAAARPSNGVFELVRRAFIDLGLDIDRVGSAAWNPLGTLIRPGPSSEPCWNTSCWRLKDGEP